MSNTITLPGGFQLVLPTTLPAIPGLPTIPGLDPAQLLPALAGANPQAQLILAAVGALIQIGHAIHSQQQAQPAGSNPSLDNLLGQWWQTMLAAFPHPQPAAPPAG